jgi:signal transduction protein with GAF and PtsI domain
MDQLLEKIVHAAAELCNAEAASILLYDKDRQALFFQAATNMEEPFMRGIVVPMDSIAGWVVLNKKPVIIHSKQPNEKSLDDRHFGEVLEGFTTRSMLGVPILIQKLSHDTSEEEVIGALEF